MDLVLAILAEVEAPSKQQLARSAFALWGGVVILTVIVLIVLWLVLRGGRRRLTRGTGQSRRRRYIPSAWEEAGRRAQGITVDIDPPPNPEDQR